MSAHIPTLAAAGWSGIYNQSLYQLVTSNGALAWQRVRLACQMANSGVQWANIISEYNSGYVSMLFPP